jgi:hypothetical protein
MTSWKSEALEEVENIFQKIYKAKDRWESFTKQLTELLLTETNAAQKAALKEMIGYISANEGYVTDQEMAESINILASRLGSNLAEKLRDDVSKFQLKSYKLAQTDLGLEFNFNQVDLKALKWLEQDQMFWIGDHFDSQLREKLMQLSAESLNGQLGRKQTIELLTESFKGEFKKSKNYWSGLSDHIITRSREFGRTEGYVKARVVSFKIVAVIDKRTSKICRYMHNRIIKVSDAVEQRNALMNAKNPEDVKKIAPWLSDKQATKKVMGKSTSWIVNKLNLCLPPYHFKCRTRTVVAYDNETEELIIDTVDSIKKFFRINKKNSL